MNLIPRGGTTGAAVLAIPGRVVDVEKWRSERKEHVAVSGPGRGAVRVDLDAVFRREYQLVVGVAARVLGSRDQAEDVAQDVFLSFGRSSVPSGSKRSTRPGFWMPRQTIHPAQSSSRRRVSDWVGFSSHTGGDTVACRSKVIQSPMNSASNRRSMVRPTLYNILK